MAYVVIVLTPKTKSVIPLRIGYETTYINQEKEPTHVRVKLGIENISQLSPNPGRVMRPFNKQEYNIIKAGLTLHTNVEDYIRHLYEHNFIILYVSLKLNDVGLYIDLIDSLNCVKIQEPTKQCLQKQVRRNRRFPIAGGEPAFRIREIKVYLNSILRVCRRFLRTDWIKERVYPTKK